MIKFLVTAEAFGYGPVITAIQVINQLKKEIGGYYCFLGSGVALEQAALASCFDEFVVCATYLRERLEQQNHLLERFDYILSSENTEGAIWGVEHAKIVFYIDNLFWMWDKIPPELCKVDTYFIAQSLDVTKNIERIGNKIKNYRVVSPLRNFPPQRTHVGEKDQLIVNLGGAESFLMESDCVNTMYYTLIQLIVQAWKTSHIDRMLVCGGGKLMQYLSGCFQIDRLSFQSLANEQYLDELHESKYIMLSPGLGNFFESLTLSQEILFLPPVNYSQFWQAEFYRSLSLGYHSINWNDFSWYVPVEQYAPEEFGVRQVLKNVKLFLSHEETHAKILRKMNNYLFNPTEREFLTNRSEFCREIGTNGIGNTVDIIKERVLI